MDSSYLQLPWQSVSVVHVVSHAAAHTLQELQAMPWRMQASTPSRGPAA